MSKFRRVIAMFLAATIIIADCPYTVFAASESVLEEDKETAISYNDYLYTELEDGTLSICGYTGVPKNDTENTYLEIPSEINGVMVTQIAEEAFAYNEVIDAVMIPETVTQIGNAAFHHCSDLKVIAFCGNAPSFGFTVVEGSHALEAIFTLESSDISSFCAILVSDLGEEEAKRIEIAEYENIGTLCEAYNAYLNSENIVSETEEEVIDSITAPIIEPITEGNVETQETIAEGTCGENLTWVLDGNGVLTISGTGDMEDYAGVESSDYSFPPWHAYKNSIEALVLEKGITRIGRCAFYKCAGITGELIIPDTVKEIGFYAFHGCSGFVGDLIIPDSVVSIDVGAFYGCSGFTGNLRMPTGLTRIANDLFYECTGLTGELIIPNGVTSIGHRAFCSCNGLTGELIIPDGVTSIGFHAFNGCSNLTGELILPKGLTSLETGVFWNCTGLTGDLVIPDSVTSIKDHAFNSCKNLTGELIISDSVATIGEQAFNGCSGLTGLKLGNGITCINRYAFAGCSSLTGELLIPDGVTNIGEGAFSGCSSLTGELVIPDSVTSIGSVAFANCSGFTGELIIPNSVTSIGSRAFQECNNLTGLKLGTGITSIENDAFVNCNSLTGELVIPSSVTSIESNAFSGCSGLTGELRIPDSVTKIGYNAFSCCSGLTSLNFGSGITNIELNAFAGCTGLTGDLVIPDSVTSIGSNAFRDCSGLNGTLTLSQNLSVIRENTFYGCTGFTGELVIPDAVTTIEKGAFYDVNKISSIVIGKGIEVIATDLDKEETAFGMGGVTEIYFTGTAVPERTTSYMGPFNFMPNLKTIHVPVESYTIYAEEYRACIPSQARIKCIGLEDEFLIEDGVLIGYFGDEEIVTIPENVDTIGTSAFQNYKTLIEVVIPSSVTKIGDYAFSGCSSLRKIELPNQLVTIGNAAFENCIGISGQLVLPETLTDIGASAFYNCTGITGELMIPQSVHSIGATAFSNCTGLTGGLTIPSGIEVIESSAFSNCTGLNGKLVIEEGVKEIRRNAFVGCENLTELELGQGIISIDYCAFMNCSSLTGDLVIPDSVTMMGSHVFRNCTALDGKLILSENLTSIPYKAFYNCTGISGELVIPDSVTEIGIGAFAKMHNVSSIVVGKGVSSITTTSNIENHVFGMNGVKAITFKSEVVPELSDTSCGLFHFMENLETIYVPANAYDVYVSKYSSYVNDSVVFTIDILTTGVTNLIASEIGKENVSLSWNPHESDKVVGYEIYRDGEIVGTTTECSFTDSNLIGGNTYTYQVYGYTATNVLTGSTQITVTTDSFEIINIDIGNSLNKVGVKNTIGISISHENWEVDKDTVTVHLYYKDGERNIRIGEAVYDPLLGGNSTAVYTTTWDITDLEDGEYTLLCRMTDSNGASDEYTKTVLVDHSVPKQIIGITAIGDISVIHLTWGISSEVDTTVYQVYRKAENEEAFQLITTINGREILSYTDVSVEKDKIYHYYVTGVNEFYQEGEPSEISGATLAMDMENPVVTKLSPGNASYLSGTEKIQLISQDNVSVTQTELYYSVDDGQNWICLASANESTFTASLDTTLLDDGEIRLKGIAYDAAGNVSDSLIYVYVVDNTGPEQVKGLNFKNTDVTITLSWDDVSDDDIRFYRVERKVGEGNYSKVVDIYDTLGANIYSLTPDTSYIYRVVGYDLQGNRGIPSEDISATTLSDTTSPVVTKIRPTSGYYSDKIALSITASDEYNIASITIQTSTDGIGWNEVYTKNYTNVSKSRNLSYTLALGEYADGYLFVRAIATDSAGNVSDCSQTAPYVQYIVDKEAPKAPIGIVASGNDGYIEVSWMQGSENDLNKYSVYRSEAENGTYKLVKSGIAAINYIDRNVEEGIVYYYKIRVNDIAGNVSDFSSVVSAEIITDTEAPVIISVYPESGNCLGYDYETVSVLAVDNNLVNTIQMEYSYDGISYMKLYEVSDINKSDKTVTTTIPIQEFEHGEKVYVRILAIDKSGNESNSVLREYTIDKEAPIVKNVEAVYEDESVHITWKSNLESDLIGYKVYRKAGTTGSYSLIAQREAVDFQVQYECYDYNISTEKTNYIYKIEAVDASGNTSYLVTSKVEIPDRSLPKPDISCESTLEVGVEYYIDASASTDNSKIVSYLFDFGDGTTSTEKKPVHVYTETGDYTITLTVTDDDGNESVATKVITVKERAVLGTAKIRVIDENGVAVVGAPVYFDLGEDTQVIKTTDKSGYVTFTADVGKHTVGCVIADNEWLPVKKEIIVTANEETSISMTLVHRVMVEGTFEITRMTFDEIVAAGIDVSKPENQYMVKVHATLIYGADTVETSFTYNETTGQTIAKPTIVTTSDGEKRQIVPVVITANKNKEEQGDDYNFSSDATIAYLDIPIGVTSLKEFFNVNLHIINNASSDFSMLNNVITLNVPEGLTLVDSYTTETNSTVTIAEIKGQTTETISWILRGDAIGTYYISADYSGIISEFNETVYTQFLSTEPIEVYGMSNLKLRVEIPEELDHGTFYYNVSLYNEGKTDVYCPYIDTGDVLIETQLFSAMGSDITDRIELDAEEIDEFGLASTVGEHLDVLSTGCRFTKHYMNVSQTSYTEKEQALKNYSYSFQNTYGLEVEFVKKPVSYFKSNLNANINASEKAELTFKTNQSAYDYLMTNENYIYWSMYASTGDVSTALTSNGQETLWNLLAFAAGDGDFKALFGKDDEELIQAILLDTMELSAESGDYSKYYAICDWTNLVKDWVKEEGHGEWINIVTKWVKKQVTDYTEEKLSKLIDDFGESLPYTFELIAAEYKWEIYKAVFEGNYQDLDGLIIGKWKLVIEERYFEAKEVYTETDASKMIHELFSAEGFVAVWKAIGISLKVAEKIVAATEKTSTDVSIFLIAQSNLDSCNLFLDTIINHMDYKSIDAQKVVKAAERIKEKMNELDVIGSLVENILDEAFWMGVDYSKDLAIKKLDLSPGGYAKLIKAALKLTVYMGNNVFNVDERHDIADNIRFVSCITIALRNGITDARIDYDIHKTDDTAKRYMQLISYLLNVRAIGESQVAQFGISYEVLPGVFDSEELFYAVRDMSGAENATSWLEWRDFVEDKISMLRVQLLKNPLSIDESDVSAPIVTFDYTKGQTAQVFSSEYEYSINGGRTWTDCDGSAIEVKKQNYAVDLLVRRKDHTDSREKLVSAITIYGPYSLNDIKVLKLDDGYLVKNLDHNKKYEISFRQAPQNYTDKDELDIIIPDGSYSYKYNTEAEYSYVYIRSLADENSYASYIYMPKIVEVAIQVTPSELELEKGETELLTAICTNFDQYEEQELIWTSSNTDVVIVENGLITAIGIGSAEITASIGEVQAVCKITVFQNHTLNFSGGEDALGEVPLPIIGQEGEIISLPTNTYAKDGMSFCGWYDGINLYPEGCKYRIPDYDVTFVAQWEKVPESIAEADILLSTDTYTYDGKAKKPSVTVMFGSKTLTSGTDYTVSYKNNKAAGTAKVTITGKGNYTGSISKTYTINKASIGKANVTLSASSYTYDGKAKKPSVTVRLGSRNLISGTDYTVSYKNNKNIGTATAVIKGKGNYSGTIKATFTIEAKKEPIIILEDAVTVFDGVDYSVIYDYNYYVAQNQDVFQAYGYNDEAVLAHFVNFGMAECRASKETFDVRSYHARYEDLQKAFGQDWKSCSMHYVLYGYNEGRNAIPSSYDAVFDVTYYLKKNKDVESVFGTNPGAVFGHFLDYGMAEGRQACSEFKVSAYKSRYSDLRKAFGDDLKAYYMHYMNFGKVEGRSGK